MNIVCTRFNPNFWSRGSNGAASRLLALIIAAGYCTHCLTADDYESPVATAGTTTDPADATAEPEQSLREGLFAEYRLDGDAKDTSGANRDAKPDDPNQAFTKDRQGKRGRAIELKGNGGLDVGEGFRFASFSVAMWIKPAGQQVPYANIIDNNHAEGINWVAQQTDDNLNQYHFGVGKRAERGAKPKGVVVPFSLTRDKWQHLVLVKNSQHVMVYVDGEVVNKAATSPAINYARPPHIRIGGLAGGGRFWKGAIDDVTLHQRALTQEEIRFLSKPPEPVALAHGSAPDMSGAWGLSNRAVIDISQDSNTVSWPGMDDGFTYSTVADWDGEKFEGILVRKNRTNGCSTEMKVLLTPQPDASAVIKTTALDNNCDLRIGFGETFTLKRITAKEREQLATAKQKAVFRAPSLAAALGHTMRTGQSSIVEQDFRGINLLDQCRAPVNPDAKINKINELPIELRGMWWAYAKLGAAARAELVPKELRRFAAFLITARSWQVANPGVEMQPTEFLMMARLDDVEGLPSYLMVLNNDMHWVVHGPVAGRWVLIRSFRKLGQEADRKVYEVMK